MTNDELIDAAQSVLHRHTTSDGRLFGDVGAALLTEKGEVHLGVCVDTASWGLCAERSAMATMITNQEYRIQKIVAVWEDDKTGKLHVLAPCGTCRDFIKNVDIHNFSTEVILGRDRSLPLSDLLPEHAWPDPLD